MKEPIILGVICALVILTLDIIWLGFIVGNFFKSQIGYIANIYEGSFKINNYAAIFVYILMVIGTIVFVIPQVNSYQNAIIYGCLFGFLIYGIFDGTNLAFIKDYPLKFAMVDIAWGTFLMGITTLITYIFKMRFL